MMSEVNLQKIEEAVKMILEANNRGRKGKALWTDREDDEPVIFRAFDTAREEAIEVGSEIASLKRRGLAEFKDIAILLRSALRCVRKRSGGAHFEASG